MKMERTEADMNTFQNFWRKTKAILKFLWRHFFTLFTLKVLVTTILTKGSANWKNAFFMLAGAILVDWAKQFIKPYSPASDDDRPYHDITAPFHIRQRWDSSLIGSSGYESRNYSPPKF